MMIEYGFSYNSTANGYGSHADPAGDLSEALAEAEHGARAQGRTLALIGHVCGTDGDPQDRAAQIRQLEAAGAIIAESNYQAATLAATLAADLATRMKQERRRTP